MNECKGCNAMTGSASGYCSPQCEEITALRARVAELEADVVKLEADLDEADKDNRRLESRLAASDEWAAQAEAVRVAAEAWRIADDTNSGPTEGMDRDAETYAALLAAEDALRLVLASCPPLESITKAALAAEEER